MRDSGAPAPEFSRVVRIADLGQDEEVYDISAEAGERAALARRFGLVAIEALQAKVRLRRLRGGAVRLRAGLHAAVAQTCVVTLEPVSETVAGEVRILYEPGLDTADKPDFEPDFESDEESEPMPGEELDIGEVVAEELALSLNPYPRTPGVEVALGPGGGPEGGKEGQVDGGNGGAGGATAASGGNPFAILSTLKRGD